jgi:two-component system nitrate/nitrite response regulator NarL
MIVSTVSPIRLLIAIPVRLYCEGLALRLREPTHFEVIGTVQMLDEALRLPRREEPSIIIMDASTSLWRHFMQRIIAECPKARILAFGVEETLQTITECTRAGARGYFDANGSLDELIDVIERIVAGELTCSQRIVADLLRRTAQPALVSDTPGLTRRQQQVLSILERGLANKQIAAALNIAEATVKNHVHQVLEKLRVPSRAQAAAFSRSA